MLNDLPRDAKDPVPYALQGLGTCVRKRIESERNRLIQELQEALAKVKLLSGMLPICAWCKKVHDDQNYWQEVECYVASRYLPRLPGQDEGGAGANGGLNPARATEFPGATITPGAR